MQGRYVKSRIKREELASQSFDMQHIVAEFAAVTHSPSHEFIDVYANMLKTAERVTRHGSKYAKHVTRKHEAMVNALRRVEDAVAKSEIARVQFQVSNSMVELYSREIRKIRQAEHHIDMIASGLRLAKWKHKKIAIEAEISDLNKKLQCCKDLDVYVKADELRDKYKDDVAQAGCFGKSAAQARLEQQDDFVKRLQQNYIENEFRVQISKLKIQLEKVEGKIALYANHSGELMDDQRAVIRASHTQIDELTQYLRQQFITHYSHVEPVCMKEMVRLYAMFMQFKNMYDHHGWLNEANIELSACMRKLSCDDFKNTDALGVYQHFLNGLGFNPDRIVVRDEDFAKLDQVLKIPFTVRVPAHTSVSASHASMFATSVHTHQQAFSSTQVSEVTAQKRAAFAASKQKSRNPHPVNDDKGKQDERDSVMYIGPR